MCLVFTRKFLLCNLFSQQMNLIETRSLFSSFFWCITYINEQEYIPTAAVAATRCQYRGLGRHPRRQTPLSPVGRPTPLPLEADPSPPGRPPPLEADPPGVRTPPHNTRGQTDASENTTFSCGW